MQKKLTREEQLACLTDRPCEVCKYHKETGCSKWTCVFEIEPADANIIEDIKAEIDKLTVYYKTEQGSELISKRAVYRVFNLVFNGDRDAE